MKTTTICVCVCARVCLCARFEDNTIEENSPKRNVPLFCYCTYMMIIRTEILSEALTLILDQILYTVSSTR